MKKEDGVAIAAPQLGIHKRFFVADRGVLPHAAIINPTWKPAENSFLNPVQEGCLSFPGILLTVDRWDTIEVEYQDLDGQSHEALLSGFSAQVFQHETDHLDGILMVDRLNSKR
jgi:peptide deformylase